MQLSPIQRLIIKRLILLLFITFLMIGAIVLQIFGVLQARDVDMILGIILILYVLPPFILGAIKLYRNHRMSAHSEYELIHSAREVIPEEVWSHIRETVADLNQCGFKVAAHFRKPGVTAATSFVTLFESVNHLTLAKLNTIFVTNRGGAPGHHSLAFFNESVDGTEFVTSNTDVLGHTPRRNNKISLNVPDVRNPRDLYELHERLVERFCKTPKPFDLDGNPAEYMKKYSEAQVAYWVKKRYYRLDETARAYRLTWKGAVLSAWKYNSLTKAIRRALRSHQTNKLLRKLEE